MGFCRKSVWPCPATKGAPFRSRNDSPGGLATRISVPIGWITCSAPAIGCGRVPSAAGNRQQSRSWETPPDSPPARPTPRRTTAKPAARWKARQGATARPPRDQEPWVGGQPVGGVGGEGGGHARRPAALPSSAARAGGGGGQPAGRAAGGRDRRCRGRCAQPLGLAATVIDGAALSSLPPPTPPTWNPVHPCSAAPALVARLPSPLRCPCLARSPARLPACPAAL